MPILPAGPITPIVTLESPSRAPGGVLPASIDQLQQRTVPLAAVLLGLHLPTSPECGEPADPCDAAGGIRARLRESLAPALAGVARFCAERSLEQGVSARRRRSAPTVDSHGRSLSPWVRHLDRPPPKAWGRGAKQQRRWRIERSGQHSQRIPHRLAAFGEIPA